MEIIVHILTNSLSGHYFLRIHTMNSATRPAIELKPGESCAVPVVYQ
ncbi:MAG: hypothetical protein M8353_05455 [ANME-2 cluster archaeon]|nr:hypothetical protein [ANME-2 cluster archaeon]